MILFCRLAVYLAAFALILSCSRENESQGQKLSPSLVKSSSSFHVKETFNVGNHVVVRALAVDHGKGHLWVGTSVGALQVELSTGEVMNTFTRENGLANEYVFAAMASRQDGVWLGTNGGGVSRYQDGDWKTFFPMHGLADYWVYSFTEQQDGTIWVGTWAGLSRIDPKSHQMTNFVKELVNEWIYGLGVDSKGNVWIGTEGGVNKYNGKEWLVWTHEDGLGAKNSQDLPFSANTGLGTRTRHDLSVVVGGKDSYNPNYVFCIVIAKDDTVWAGTWGGGASHFDGQKWTNYTTDDGLAGNIVYSMASGLDGDVWFGTNNGLSRFNGQHWQTVSTRDGLLDPHVYAVTATTNGDVWAGTKGGVARISQNSDRSTK